MDDLTLKALEKAKEASDRGRWVLLVMQVACIVVFMAAWHEVPESWTYARLKTARAAVWFLDCSPQGHPELSSSEFETELNLNKHEECHFIEGGSSQPMPNEGDSHCTKTHPGPFCDDELSRAKRFLARGGLSPIQARKYLENLEASFVERTMNVTVPFLGITLDTNDLGLLGGITFLLLLTWLLYSLRREEENVAMLFARTSDEDLLPSYQLLSMTQVLTIPIKIREKGNRLAEVLWTNLGKALGKVLFILPLVVQCFVVWYDRRTLAIGTTLNPKGAISEFRWEIGLLAAVFVLTVLCLRSSAAVGRRWKDAYNRIRPHLKHEKFC